MLRTAPPPQPQVPLAFLGFTATVSGAIVMVVEVMGSRVIGPFFGVSLFVWTALITVTLVALAAGYAIGGLVADRRPTPDVLYGLLGLAGLTSLLVPLLSRPVLETCASLGLRSGALAAAAVLFGPCLFLLGCVSPYVVRLAACEMGRIGRTVGMLYSLSTVGSFLGTLATGFVLTAHLGVRGVFQLVGATLLALSLSYWLLIRRLWLVGVAAFLPLMLASQPPPGVTVRPSGTRVAEVHRRDGFYASLKVIDYTQEEEHTRELMLDGLIQGGVDVRTGLSVYEYAYFLEFLPWGMRSGGTSCLVIGLGAGIVPRWYQERGVRCDVVDINPDVVEVARDWFDFRPSGDVYLDDARRFLRQSDRRYDYIVLDVFTGDTTPGHLVTLEALSLVRDRLADEGILAINLIASLGPESHMTVSLLRTLERVFATVETYPTFDPAGDNPFGNVIVVARRGPPLTFDPARVASFPVYGPVQQQLARFLGRRFSFPATAPAMILTDDFNPIDVRDIWLKERVRRDILSGTDWEVLL